MASTPAADGFHMPGEFEPHTGCWMIWPERRDNWREGAGPAQQAYAAVAEAIAGSEEVTVGASDAQYERARALLAPAIRVVELVSDDAWMRDLGPSFLVDRLGGLAGVDWRFNAWGGGDGGLYARWDRDERVARKVLEVERAPRYEAPIVLEGGAVHVDGQGTVLSTEECLLNPNRNPGCSREEIERALCEHLGAEAVIWLGSGLPGDETNGHVDNIACFARPGVVLLAWTDDRSDPLHAICVDARARLLAARDARGGRLEVVPLPVPGPLTVTEDEVRDIEVVAGTMPRRAGARLAASYVNFYPANDRIVYPLLDPRTDDAAAAALADCFPDRELAGVSAREILLGGGGIHCITQQVPRAPDARDTTWS
jgi:agmatine deiminase